MTTPDDHVGPTPPTPDVPFRPTWSGTVLHLFTASGAGVEMDELASADFIAGYGIEGDRYARRVGHYSYMHHDDRQVTLIEVETLDALRRDHSIDLTPRETRRNVVTSGVPLNHLVGQRFRLGDVLLLGGRLNVPCKYLEELLDKPVFGPLINRSGLNCQILTSGTVRRDDRIVPA